MGSNSSEDGTLICAQRVCAIASTCDVPTICAVVAAPFEATVFYGLLILSPFLGRKIMLLFPEDQKTFTLQEIERIKFGHVIGQSTMSINKDKATFLAKNSKQAKNQSEEDIKKTIETLLSSKLPRSRRIVIKQDYLPNLFITIRQPRCILIVSFFDTIMCQKMASLLADQQRAICHSARDTQMSPLSRVEQS